MFKIKIKKDNFGILRVYFCGNKQHPIDIDLIPAEELHPFWGSYTYTHAGDRWKKAAEFISELKRQGFQFHEYEGKEFWIK